MYGRQLFLLQVPSAGSAATYCEVKEWRRPAAKRCCQWI
jgi:hypothetical protein